MCLFRLSEKTVEKNQKMTFSKYQEDAKSDPSMELDETYRPAILPKAGPYLEGGPRV